MNGELVPANSAVPAAAQPPQDKSVGVALILTFLFGALGLLYTEVWWRALLVCFLEVVIVVATLGVGLLVMGPIIMIWAAVSASHQHTAFQLYLAACQQS
jgi:hypothetical protein